MLLIAKIDRHILIYVGGIATYFSDSDTVLNIFILRTGRFKNKICVCGRFACGDPEFSVGGVLRMKKKGSESFIVFNPQLSVTFYRDGSTVQSFQGGVQIYFQA